MKTILVPVDFSLISEEVVKEAASLARSLDGRIVLLTVVQPPVVMNEYASLLNTAELVAAGEKNAERQLAAVEETLRKQSLSTKGIFETGAPVSVILEQARECEADYIVMGSHGHTAFYDLLVGSTTHGVLNRATCPVVIVPAKKDLPSANKLRK